MNRLETFCSYYYTNRWVYVRLCYGLQSYHISLKTYYILHYSVILHY